MHDNDAHHQHESGTARALGALELLRRFRFLTARQLQLAGGCDSAELHRLEDAGLVLGFGLADPFAPKDPERVYALLRAGAAALVQHRGLDQSDVPYLTLGQRHRSLLTLRHTLSRNEFALALEAACREDGEAEFVGWEHRPDQLRDAAFLYDERRGSERVPLVADGFALLRYRGVLHGLLLETDRGTVGVPRMTLRYRGYFSWWQSGGPERRFGVRALRVLTVAPTEKRVERLRVAAAKAVHRGKGSRLLWFTTEDAMQIGSDVLHASVWRLAHERNGRRWGLFEPA